MAIDQPSVADLQWHLDNHGQSINGVPGRVGAGIHARSAWPLEQGSRQVIVAVVDSGFDLTHPALSESRLAIPATYDHPFKPHASQLEVDHGTHIAALAVGSKLPSGLAGVAPGCAWLPVAVDLAQHNRQAKIEALNWLADLASGAAERYIVNLSWEILTPDQHIEQALTNLFNSGAVIVAAAGNVAVDTHLWPRQPGSCKEVVTVAATDNLDRKTEFSAFGTDIDVCAPGFEIYSAWRGAYAAISGTSQACALTAGVLGLIWSRNTQLDNMNVRKLLLDTCDPIDQLNPGFEGMLGAGRVNATRAVRAVPRIS